MQFVKAVINHLRKTLHSSWLQITENGVIVFVDKETDQVNAEDFSYPADLSNVEDSLVAVMWGHLISANVRHRVSMQGVRESGLALRTIMPPSSLKPSTFLQFDMKLGCSLQIRLSPWSACPISSHTCNVYEFYFVQIEREGLCHYIQSFSSTSSFHLVQMCCLENTQVDNHLSESNWKH